jgi:hypothetical protein
MEDRPRDTLKRSILIGLAALGVAALLIWVMPLALDPLLSPGGKSKTQSSVAHTVDDVDRSVQEWLRRVGAVEVLNRESGGVIRAIYRLPRGAKNGQIVHRIRSFADEANLEVYVRIVDGIDVELRAYHGPDLRHQLLLIPDLPDPPTFSKGVKDPNRPLLAIIVTGLGEAAAASIIDQPVPVTVAIKPFTPFSLRIARRAAASWHEVIVDLPNGMAPSEAQHAVPHATGIWVNGAPVTPLAAEDVVVVPADRMGRRKSHTRRASRVLPVQQRERRTTMETLQRVRHIAARSGVGALVVKADDPELGEVLAWAAKAHRYGYRMVLATEAARGPEVQGPTGGLATAFGGGGLIPQSPR